MPVAEGRMASAARRGRRLRHSTVGAASTSRARPRVRSVRPSTPSPRRGPPRRLRA
jgi:hypothetical protein